MHGAPGPTSDLGRSSRGLAETDETDHGHGVFHWPTGLGRYSSPRVSYIRDKHGPGL